MRTVILAAAALIVAATFSQAAAAQEVPFPAPQIGDVFIASQTVSTTGTLGNFYAPGATVVFRAYAVDMKTQKFLAGKDVKYFYVTIPGQPNVKLQFNPTAPGASARMPWVGTWRIPSTYAVGLVNFKILIKAKSKRQGLFVQLPIASSQLTVATTPPVVPTDPVGGAQGTTTALKLPLSIYVDTVNGTRPPAAAPRPVGCSQTNVFKRGEQLVIRSWGTDVATGDVLSAENIDVASATIPGQPTLTMNWGAHGAASNRVWFWSAAWNVPTDYALGETTLRIVYRTDDGKTGTYQHTITIIP